MPDCIRARDDLRPSALAGKRDWYKTHLSLSCPSCTKVLHFKLHSHNDLREGLQTTAFSLVCHGVSCNVMGRHRSSPCFDDFVRSFRFRFAHFDCRTGGRVIVGNHPCSDRVNDASRLHAFVALGEIASGFVPSRGLRADPRQTRCLVVWLLRSMPAAISGSLAQKGPHPLRSTESTTHLHKSFPTRWEKLGGENLGLLRRFGPSQHPVIPRLTGPGLESTAWSRA